MILGLHKHVKMVSVYKYVNGFGDTKIDINSLWNYFNDSYDLESLDELNSSSDEGLGDTSQDPLFKEFSFMERDLTGERRKNELAETGEDNSSQASSPPSSIIGMNSPIVGPLKRSAPTRRSTTMTVSSPVSVSEAFGNELSTDIDSEVSAPTTSHISKSKSNSKSRPPSSKRPVHPTTSLSTRSVTRQESQRSTTETTTKRPSRARTKPAH